VEVVVYANTRDKEVDAKTVEVVRYASIREEEAHAKTALVDSLKKVIESSDIYSRSRGSKPAAFQPTTRSTTTSTTTNNPNLNVIYERTKKGKEYQTNCSYSSYLISCK